eukprot:Rhum_TRINITY_DN24485_c0_g1::Rhum_TRINITY_DN24485_c0_g1_i1::g.179825::m.179825
MAHTPTPPPPRWECLLEAGERLCSAAQRGLSTGRTDDAAATTDTTEDSWLPTPPPPRPSALRRKYERVLSAAERAALAAREAAALVPTPPKARRPATRGTGTGNGGGSSAAAARSHALEQRAAALRVLGHRGLRRDRVVVLLGEKREAQQRRRQQQQQQQQQQ